MEARKKLIRNLHDAVDFEKLLIIACSNISRLLTNSRSFLESNPDWSEAVQTVPEIYSDVLSSIHLNENDKNFDLDQRQLQVANLLALLIIFGSSHYLQWAGFDIIDPVNFSEISTKLGFARKAAYTVGITLVRSMPFGDIGNSNSYNLSLPGVINEYYSNSFGIGVYFGYLINMAYLKGIRDALSLVKY